MAFGSFSVFLKYIRQWPGMPCFRWNAWELEWLLNVGRVMCGGNGGGCWVMFSSVEC